MMINLYVIIILCEFWLILFVGIKVDIIILCGKVYKLKFVNNKLKVSINNSYMIIMYHLLLK